MKGNRLKVEIAQLSLSDLGCGKHTCMPTPRRKIPFIAIRFSTDREPVGPGEIIRFRTDFTLSGEGGSPTNGE
jgi:hypothetical protein